VPALVAHIRTIAVVAAVTALGTGIGGCAKFDKALGQQWIQVTFAPNTTIATAKHITSVCSHIPNLPLLGKVRSTTADVGYVDEVNYNSTNATDAQIALLEQCLDRFPNQVQGFTEMDQGDSE
jgi:hypothetical protein